MRTTIYLAGPAAEVLDRVRTEHRVRYGIATTISSVVARLLLGESVDEVTTRPYRSDLARIAAERDKLRDDLQRGQAKRRTDDLHRVHRAIADLYPRVKQVTSSLGRARRRNEPYSADFTEAAQIEESGNELMADCADAIVRSRRR